MARRAFQFIGGSSKKFWHIERSGKSHTVHFGRIGTAGQGKTKDFATEADAQKAYDRLIAEKLKEGYKEVGSGASGTKSEQAEKKPAASAKKKASSTAKDSSMPPAPTTQIQRDVHTEVTHRIDLEPADWFWATWKPWKPLPQSESRSFDPEACFQRMLEPSTDNCYRMIHALCLRDEVLLFRTAEELAVLRTRLAAKIDVNVQPAVNWQDQYPLSIHHAAVLGCHDEIRRIVAGWEKEAAKAPNTKRFYHPTEFIFALGDPELIEAECRRLQLRWDRPARLRAWLATTELRALDVVRDSVLAALGKKDCEQLLEVFTKVKAPEAAEYMLELSQSAKSPRLAREWLESEVGNAITGLIPVAAGKGKLAATALQYLREKKREGHANLIAAALKGAPAEVAAKIKQEVVDHVEKVYPSFTDKSTPTWLAKAVKAASKLQPLPGAEFVQIARLPAILIDGKRLTPEQTAAVLLALQHSEWNAVNTLVTELKKHADAESMVAFAWELFQQWLGETAPTKHKWTMKALGFLGSDATAMKLTPLVRAWPGENQHPRAVLGLECLRAIGTDSALMCLNGIAQKLKFKALKERALECMEGIAHERGMARAELEDCIVPDFDLDERGRRVFDFGPRHFTFALGPNLKPMVRDDAGQLREDLPKSAAKDDQEKASAATEEWKTLKKQLRDVLKIQPIRLEQAMVTCRRWPPDKFEMLLVKHPLMTHLVRLLLWGGYDAKGKLKATFRVTEDQTYANIKDETFQLKGLHEVGIVHPLHLPKDQVGPWGEIFSDYELIPPFPQLGRSTYELDDKEKKNKQILRFIDATVPGTTLVGTLERQGWIRGAVLDNGAFEEHVKPFHAANVTAVVNYENGLVIGYVKEWEDQKLVGCYFVPGIYLPTNQYPNPKRALPLKSIDEVVISEVLKDLTMVVAKGK